MKQKTGVSAPVWALIFVLLGFAALFGAVVVQDHDLKILIAAQGVGAISGGMLAFKHSEGLDSVPPAAPIQPAPQSPANQ